MYGERLSCDLAATYRYFVDLIGVSKCQAQPSSGLPHECQSERTCCCYYPQWKYTLDTELTTELVRHAVKNIRMTFIASSALILAGCGGGSGSANVSAPPPSFIVWAGSSGGSNVIDGPGHRFAFFSDTGCLFNFQTGQENTAFCLSPRSNFVDYGAFHGQVVNVLASNGT
jgi:hypothetical protein